MTKAPQTCFIKCYSIATINILNFSTIFDYVSFTKQEFFSIKVLSELFGQESKSLTM